ncbi:hypothetical protein JXO52_09225 [bacterium]|nr:hypothetical protein [bacterium]
MRFCTAVSCMDGRIQVPVIEYLQLRYNVEYVDMITEAGPNAILTSSDNHALTDSILKRIEISLTAHNSVGIAVAGHHDCTGNPVPKEDQLSHIEESVYFLQKAFPDTGLVGLWVDRNLSVSEVCGA